MRKIFDGFVLTMVALVATAVRDVVVFADSIGIAQTAGGVGETISVDTVGVYEFPSVDAEKVKVGDVLYWDEADKNVTLDADSGTNKRAGIAWSAKLDGVVALINVKIG